MIRGSTRFSSFQCLGVGTCAVLGQRRDRREANARPLLYDEFGGAHVVLGAVVVGVAASRPGKRGFLGLAERAAGTMGAQPPLAHESPVVGAAKTSRQRGARRPRNRRGIGPGVRT